MPMKIGVRSLDVWGHGPDEHEKYDCDGNCEGWTVNNVFSCGEIEVSGDTDEAIIGALVEGGYLTPDCTPKHIAIESDGCGFYTVDRRSDGKPLLQLDCGEGELVGEDNNGPDYHHSDGGAA